MKLLLEIGDFKLDVVMDSEQSATGVLVEIAKMFHKHGVVYGSNKLVHLLKEEFDGKPGWSFADGHFQKT